MKSGMENEEKRDNIASIQPSFIDLFSGCGGLSLGLLQAGWKGIFAIEKEENAFKTFHHNLLENKRVVPFDWPSWLPPKAHSIEELLTEYPKQLSKTKSEVVLVAGGPPCQGFSLAGSRKPDDPRNQLIDRFIETIQLVKPKLVLLENVQGIRAPFLNGEKKSKAKPLAPSEIFAREIDDIGYHSKWITLESERFGVAQSRTRSFLIAIQKQLSNNEALTNLESLVEEARRAFLRKKGMGVTKPITVEDAISDLQTTQGCGGKKKRIIPCLDSKGFEQIEYEGPETAYQKLLHKGMKKKEPPNSMRLVKHRKDTIDRFAYLLLTQGKGRDLSTHLFQKFNVTKHCLSILHPTKPAPTITSIPDDFIHYCEPRVLTVRELARVQSFPDWFEFLGKYTTGGKRRKQEVPRYTQVANAVPPFVAEVIGNALKKILLEPS